MSGSGENGDEDGEAMSEKAVCARSFCTADLIIFSRFFIEDGRGTGT